MYEQENQSNNWVKANHLLGFVKEEKQKDISKT